MRFNLNELNAGNVFYFDEEDKDRGFIKIRLMTLAETERINKITSKTERIFKKGAFHTETKVNEDKRNEMIWDYVLMSWSGITDENGNEIECNTSNKLLLFNNSPMFSQFVLECVNQLNETQNLQDEILEKN